jgi:hypothetical protein
MTEQTQLSGPKPKRGSLRIALWVLVSVMFIVLIYIISFFVMGLFFERQQFYTYAIIGNYTRFSTQAGFVPEMPVEAWEVSAFKRMNAFYRPLFAYTRYEPEDTGPLIGKYEELIREVLRAEQKVSPNSVPDHIEVFEFEHTMHINILISRRVIQYSYYKDTETLRKDPQPTD